MDVGYKKTKKGIIGKNGALIQDKELEIIIQRSKRHKHITAREMFYLMDKNLKDLQLLMFIGGVTLPYLLQIEKKYFHSIEDILSSEINSITYITPDTILIYLAEKALRNTSMSIERKTALERLYSRFSSIDIKILAEWRFFFLEYLNLLSACHRNPALKDEAESFAKVCQVGFPVDSRTNTEDESEFGQFNNDFLTIWKPINRIEAVYENALRFFDKPYEGIKPFGAVVGPITERMIQAQEIMSADEKSVLINLVNNSNICDEDSDEDLTTAMAYK